MVIKMERPHPLYLYYDIKKWLVLLLLPVFRSIFSHQDTVSVILSSLRDVLIAACLISYSVAKWRRARYALKGGLTFEHGLIFRRFLRVTAQDAASVEIERSPLMWLAGGRRVRINTAGLRRRADATIFLSSKAALNMAGERSPCNGRRVSSHIFPTLILSASSSNAALGLLTLAPALRQAGQILGREVTSEVYGLFNRLISLGLPPFLDATAHILVLGWCFAFLRTFTRTAGFTTQRRGQQLFLLSGLITVRKNYIDCGCITAMELRQTLFMRLFGLHTVTITAAGYGREKGARPIIIPAARPRELCSGLDTLLPEYPTCPATLHPPRRALLGYVLPPLILTLASLLPLYAGGVWHMLAVVCFLAGIWWLSIRLSGYSRAGFGVSDRAVTMRYSRGLALYEIHVPRELADCVRIIQAPWQRHSKTCTVELRCFGEKRRRHRVRALPLGQAQILAQRLIQISNRPYTNP
ncbi:MAG: PH domain-containing protein [Oscillospiraceae bacterium]|nr:PH domain-containing protein [Oscillospiraceae bacterium]MDD4546471.1 PH domain-containing protein [Oscillospiraceae bacterium]